MSYKPYAHMELTVALTMDRETAASLLSLCGKVGAHVDTTYRGDSELVYNMLRDALGLDRYEAMPNHITNRYRGDVRAQRRDDKSEAEYLAMLDLSAEPTKHPDTEPDDTITIVMDIPTALTIGALVGVVTGGGKAREQSSAIYNALRPLRGPYSSSEYIRLIANKRIASGAIATNPNVEEPS